MRRPRLMTVQATANEWQDKSAFLSSVGIDLEKSLQISGYHKLLDQSCPVEKRHFNTCLLEPCKASDACVHPHSLEILKCEIPFQMDSS